MTEIDGSLNVSMGEVLFVNPRIEAFDVSGDGQRFLGHIVPEMVREPFTMVTSWTAETVTCRQLVPMRFRIGDAVGGLTPTPSALRPRTGLLPSRGVAFPLLFVDEPYPLGLLVGISGRFGRGLLG